MLTALEEAVLIKNGRVVTPEGILECADILVEDGKIRKIGKRLTDPGEVIDAEGCFVTPGFIDIHTHGGYEADFMDATDEAWAAALAFHLDNGTTSTVATSCTAPVDSIVRFLDFTRAYMAGEHEGACRVLGAHLEGPFLSVKNKGAQKLEQLAVPARDDYSYMLDYAEVIKTVTIAPELEGADKMTRELTLRGIVVSGGHDDGIYPEFMPAVEAGLSHLTHLYCAMSDLRFKDGRRNVGLREYGLTDDRLTAEIIADNRHIPPMLARLIVRAKGADRVCVVSDSLRAAGQPADGRVYKLGSDEDAVRFVIGDGVAVVENSATYAGSITPVRRMVKNLIDAGIPVCAAVKMGTLTPARIVGEDKELGSLEIGKHADICILDESFELVNLVLNGRKVR